MQTFCIIAFIALYTFLAIRDFHVAMCFLVFALPSYLIRFNILGIPYTLLELMIWLLFIVYLFKLYGYYHADGLKKWLKKPSIEFLSLRVAMMLFFVSAGISVLISPTMISAAGIWKAYFLEALLFFVIFITSVRSEKEMKNIIRMLGLSVISIFIFGVFQKFTGWKLNPIYMVNGEVDRVTSIYGYPNAIGLYCAPIIAFYVGNLITRLFNQSKKILLIRDWTFWFELMVIFAGTISILLAKSEGAIVGLLVTLFVIGMITKKLRIPTIIIAGALVIIIALNSPLRNSIFTKATFSDWSGQVRVTMWKETLPMIKDNFLLGVGLSGYPIEFVKYHKAWYIEIFQYPHNIILNFWLELGLLGLLSFMWLVVEYVRFAVKAWSKYREYAMGLIMAIIVILVHGLVDVPYFKNDLSMMFWILMGIGVVLNRKGFGAEA